MNMRNLPIPNIAFAFKEPYLVLFRQGPKWVVAPFETFEEAEHHADFLENKWTASQIYVLRNSSKQEE